MPCADRSGARGAGGADVRCNPATERRQPTTIDTPPALRSGLLLLALCACMAAQARLVEQVIQVPVKVTDAYGKVIEQASVVSLYPESTTPAPRPIALVNHGRAAEADKRASMGRATSITNARWLAGMGFLVVVPTRLGYGVTGGEDVEDSGPCEC
ncbi:MAG: hypothetical protein ACK5YM_09230 [Pseudomonadota bacterium]